MAWSDWILDAEIGRGAMGRVFRARSASTGAPVALKTIAVPDRRRIAQVAREAAAMARLDHPHVIAIHDFGPVPDGALEPGLWIAMDWWEGGTAAHHPPRDGAEAVRSLGQLLLALAHAHAHGIVHRDVKPANLLLSGDGQHLVLADFGLASAPRAGARSGTPMYMAPEQALGLPQGPTTDLYAVGALAWQWFTGHPPFTGEVDDVLDAQVNAPLPRFAPRIDAPDGIDAWIARCLAKSPHDRFPSAAEARRALARLAPLPAAGWLDAPRSTARVDVGVRTLWPLRVPPLVGREVAWAALVDAWRAVGATGGVRVVPLVGPEGSGRSALAGRFVRALAHAGVVALPLRDEPRAAALGVLRELVGDLSDDAQVRRWCDAAGHPELVEPLVAFGEDPTRTGAPEDLAASALAARGQPVALALDGPPGAWPAALTLAGVDALVLHPAEPGADGLALDPLTPDQVVELVAQALGEGADTGREAYASAGGHPASLIAWLVRRRGLGFAGALPDAGSLSDGAVSVGLIAGHLPQPADPAEVASIADALGVTAEPALIELVTAGALAPRWGRLQVDLGWLDALARRDAQADRGVRRAVGARLIARESTALEGVGLLAHSDRPDDALRAARELLARGVPPEELWPLLDPVPESPDPELAGLARVVRCAGATPARLDPERFRAEVDAWLSEPVSPRPAWWLAAGMRLESVCFNGYRDPTRAARVTEHVAACDAADAVPTGWGELVRSMAPWRASDPAAIALLEAAIARARAAREVRAEWAACCQLGQFVTDRGRFAEAVALYERAVALRPDEPSARVLLALGLDGLGAPAREVDAHLDAAWAEGWRMRPRLRAWLAVVRCSRQLDAHPGDRRDDRLEHALRVAERAAALHAAGPQAAQAALMVAVYAALHGDHDHALAAWDRFEARIPAGWSEPRVLELLERLAPVAPVALSARVMARIDAQRALLGGARPAR